MAQSPIKYAPLPYGLTQGAGLKLPSIPAAPAAAQNFEDITRQYMPAPYQAEQPAARTATVAYSPSLKKFFVAGRDGAFTFDDGNDTAVAESMKVIDPSKPAPLPPGDWTVLSPEGFSNYARSITDPSMAKLAKKNFGIGVDNMQALAGYGLQFAGAEQTGRSIVKQQEQDLAKTMVYQRNATDIGSDPSRGVMDWFVANLAQQGPNMVESVVTAVIGAAAGGAAGAPTGPGAAVSAAGGAIAGLVGKSAFKAGLLAAAKKYAEGQALSYAEKRLLVEAAALTAAGKATLEGGLDAALKGAGTTALKAGSDAAFKQAGKIAGAGLATFANNQAMGIADVYGETVQNGAPDRSYAAAASVPYSLLESAPEFLLAGRLFGDIVHGGNSLAGRSIMGKAGELLRRGAVGGAVGALSEGGVEAGQEALLMAANPAIDWNSPDSIARLFNSFAAGAGVGGPIGSLANLRGHGEPANLLQPTDTTLALPAPPDTPLLTGPGSTLPSPAIRMPGLTTSGNVPAGLQQPLNIQQPVEGSPTVSMSGTATGTLPTDKMVPSSVTGQGLFSYQPPSGPPPNIAQNPYANAAPAPTTINASPVQGTAPAPAAPVLPPSVDAMMQKAQGVLGPAQNPLTTTGQATGKLVPVTTAQATPAANDLPMPDGVTAEAITKMLADAPPEAGTMTVPPLSKGDSLKRGKAMTESLLGRDYGALADALKADPSPIAQARAALAEKLATMSDPSLRKLSKVWDSKFEPDVAADPAAVSAMIDRAVGKKKPLKVEKPAAPAPKEAANAAPAPAAAAPAAAPAPVAKPAAPIPAAVPAAAAPPAPAAAALKKGAKPKAPVVLRKNVPPKPAEPEKIKLVLPDTKKSVPKNDAGVASPAKKAAEEPKVSTETDELKTAIDTWDDPKDTGERTSAAQYLLNVAFFGDSNDSTYGRAAEARKALDKMLSDAEMEGGDAGVALDNAIVAEARSVNDADKRAGKGERSSQSDNQKAFKELIAKRGLTSRIKAVVPDSETLQLAGDVEEMTSIIEEMLTKKGEMQDTAFRSRKMNEAKVVYNRLRKDGKDPMIFGVKVSKLFKNGRLDIQLDTETKTYRLAIGFDLAKDIIAAADAPKGMFSRLDNGKATKSYAPAEITMMVKSMLAKYATKPTVSVFRNVADMKARDPALFKRAAAAREAGDFESTPAAGYSFGDQVIIFSDHVRSEQHLANLLAHETIGHFGLRSILSKTELNSVLDDVYNSDPRLKAEIDQMEGDRRENTEEYLATYAATLETSIIAKVWNAIKNVLNKLGVTFDDDHARQIIGQARKYVRSPEGSFFSATSFHDTLQRMAVEHSEGRFSASPLDDKALSGKFMGAQALNRFTGEYGGLFGAAQYLRDNNITKALGMAGASARDTIGKIASIVETLDNKAARSAGLTEVFKLFERQHNLARQLLSKYNSLTAFTHKPNWIVAKKDAPTEADKEEAGELLAFATLARMGDVDAKLMDSFPELITLDKYGNPVENTAVIERLKKAGFVTADEFRKGLKWKDATGNEQTYPARKIDEKSKAWKIYVEQREAVASAAIDVLRSHYDALTQLNKIMVSNLGSIEGKAGNKFTADDLKTLRDISKEFYTLYLKDMKIEGAQVALNKENAKAATDFIYETTRVMYEDKKLQDWLKADPEELASKFQGQQYKYIIDRLSSLAKVRLSEKDLGRMQQALQNAAMSKVDAINSEYYAKRTILGSYAPLKRDGKFQVKLKAYDAKGKQVVLSDQFQGIMPYFREDERKAADKVMSELDSLFGDKTYNVIDANGSEVAVKFKAEYSKARLTPDLGDVTDYNSFIYVLTRQNINITPQERQRLVEGLTRQGSMARSNLQRTGNPGWRRAMIRNVSEYLETSAHAAAKRTYRTQMDAVLDRHDMWQGSKEKLAALKAAYEVKGLSASRRAYLKREYDDYARKFVESWPVDGTTVEINGKKVPTKGNGEAYHEDAKSLLRWQADNLNIVDSTEDVLSSDLGAKLKTGTVLMQLGMSVATAVINLGSLATHSLTYMSFYNPKNGFGMGMGMAESATALTRALADLKSFRFDDAEFIKSLLEKNTYKQYGLTRDEAEYLFEQTTNGTLQAAAFDALIGSARGKVQSNRMSDVIQKWMAMFSYTEQLNRRVTALAAYRLEKARGMAAGLSEAEAMKMAGSAAHEAVNTSQGLYSMFNRPELARGNIGQYLFMYKMFTAITVQMMRNLPPAGQVTFLAMMLVASGIKGVPFAEDIMDLIDTIAQMFGLKMPSIEKEAYSFFDSLAPGYAPYFMRGALDQLTGSTVSSKMGMGDIVPLSGALKYGADPWNEVKQFAGPVFGATMGLGSWAQMIGRYGSEVVGIQPDTTTATDVLRNSPLAVLRSIGDSLAYSQTGMITNIRGQVVSRDVGYSTVAMRAMGFYPAESTRQNDTIRLVKMSGEYAKALKAKVVNAYTQAAIRRDTDTMKRIVEQVRDWNIDAKGTGLEIKDFQKSAERSLKEARREAITRFRRTVSKQMQPQLDELMRLQGIDPTD